MNIKDKLQYFRFRQTGKMKILTRIALTYTAKKLQLVSVLSTQKAAEKAFTLFCTPQKRVKHNNNLLADAEMLTAKVNGMTVYGYRWNSAANKKILIAHGFESSAANFTAYVKPFITKGYQVLAFDAPAHGISDGNQIVLPLYIATIEAVYKAFGPFDAYMAHSFGGLAVTHFLQHIEHDANTKLVLVAPAAEIISVIDRFFRLLKLNNKVRIAFDKLSEEATGISPSDASILHTLKKIQADILWLHDTEDDITPYKDLESIQKNNFPNIKFVISSGLGHRKIYRDEQSIKAIANFV